jgi:hypothetical protein
MSVFDPKRHLDAMAQTLGLTIEAAWRPDVEQFLTVAARMADLLDGFPPGEALEHAAPVFRPGEPEA